MLRCAPSRLVCAVFLCLAGAELVEYVGTPGCVSLSRPQKAQVDTLGEVQRQRLTDQAAVAPSSRRTVLWLDCLLLELTRCVRLKAHCLLVAAGVSPVEDRDAAVDGVDVGEGVAVDGDDVGVEARREPALTVREVARGSCVVGRCG